MPADRNAVDHESSLAVDRTSARPLWEQIQDSLAQQISSRTLPPGASLPTEEDLTAEFGVSRSVVRQALGALANQGLIHRQRGRGSVVAARDEHHRRAEQAGGLRQQIAQTGQNLRTDLLELKHSTPPAVAAELLGTTDTWQMERLRHVDAEPVVFMRTWVPREVLPHLTAEQLSDGSLHDLMRSVGVEPSGGPRQVQAVPADGIVAARLGVEPGSALLLLEGVTRDATGRGLEWFSAWHRPHTVFDIDATVGDTAPAARETPQDLTRIRQLLDELDGLIGRSRPTA